MSSSMRNAVQRRNHKERSQPHERTKWGLLEKRKDYQQRSRDYNAKKATKRALAAVARERNPDEFYFAMTSSRTRDGGIRVAERPESGGVAFAHPGRGEAAQDSGSGVLEAEGGDGEAED
jgi:U3 small nucleolar RNA-associated protein 11